jgi:hypothetical protein
MRRGGARAGVAAACLLAVLAACQDADTGRIDAGAPSTEPAPSATPSDTTTTPEPSPTASPSDFSVEDPGRFAGPLLSADVLVTSTAPIPLATVARVAGVKGVAGVTQMSVASLSSNGRTLTIAAVDDLAEFRRFTPVQSARADEVWSRVAGGEVAVDPSMDTRLERPKGFLTLGTQKDAPEVHIGAYAPMVKRISAVVDRPRGEQLGMVPDNALLVSTGELTPSVLTDRIRRIVGRSATLEVLALEFEVDVPHTAVLTGTSAAEAVGSFSYTPLADGRVVPDSRWVAANIRTEQVPILGEVTCHRVMLPQLRSALAEVVQRGLADKIHRDEFAGCYYPRFIARDPAKGLSLHSWGIAVDLNVPGNQRGTVGEMDRQVVAIFKKWGFAWGGDWSYTDPMHFELASIVKRG